MATTLVPAEVQRSVSSFESLCIYLVEQLLWQVAHDTLKYSFGMYENPLEMSHFVKFEISRTFLG